MTFRLGLLVPLFLVLCSRVSGQSASELDSLLGQGKELSRKEPKKAISIGFRVLANAEGIQKSRAEYLLMRSYEKLGKLDSAAFFGALATTSIQKLNDQEREADYRERYARVLRNMGEFEKALSQYEKSLAIYESAGDSAKIAYLENSIGISYKKMGLYTEALSHYRRALKIRRALKEIGQVAQVTNNIGNVLRYQGELDSALSNYLMALEVFEELADSGNMTNALNNIGLVQENNGNAELALQYYRRALHIRQLIKDYRGLHSVRNNIAIIYRKQGKVDSALFHFQRNLEYALKTSQKDAEALARHNIASAYMDTENWVKAVEGFKRALAIRMEINDRYGVASCNQNLAECFRRMGRAEEAIPYAEVALSVSEEIGASVQSAEVFKTLHECYQAIGNYEKAYQYQSFERAIRDSLFAADKLQTITQMELRFESEKRSQQLRLAEQENQLQEEKIKSQQSTRNYLFAIIAIGVVVVVILFLQAISLKSANDQLTTQKEVLASNAEEKELLLNEIHHRVKNNLQVVSSLLSMQSREVKDEQVLAALKEGRDRVHSMALVHQMFYQNHENAASIEAHKYVEQLCESLMRTYGAEELGVRLKLDMEHCLLDIDRATLIGLIINELVSNSLKHAFTNQADKQLSISLRSESDNFILQVNDNGSGQQSERKSESFGLKLVSSMTTKLKGQLTVVKEGGFSTRIEFPKSV